ncbi:MULTISPECIES: histone-like nucleoid-structuring protein Lsr2 [Streptomyces]|uniref:Lsr2 family protein n=1 Tax=Streptomyces gibsoniae TaxID=3075529 RepID=A0ABU2U1Q7_9ACTN|nr:Lsr2 family protein [Streptomyces sp. DSM 41699]MDT0467109.1 Lsr2 family protein [Streptomyces sp. DSM 41699]
MVQKMVTVYTDDLTGTESDEVSTHRFSLNGIEYEIDLNPENYDKLDAALRPFIERGRKVGRTKVTGRVRGGAAAGPSAEEVRAWARENGYEVNDRGRVPRELREVFEAAR